MTKPSNNNQSDKKANSQDTDDALNSLYQQRKGKHTSPSAVKQALLNTLAIKERRSKPWWKMNLRSYTQVSAVACSIAVAFIVISLQMVNKPPSPMMLESAELADTSSFQSVELHVLAPETEQLAKRSMSQSDMSPQKSTAQERKVQYQSAQSVYRARQADLAVYQQAYATIVNSEDGLSLLTCDKSLLKLSKEVVDLLVLGQDKETIDFSDGKMVALAFDRNGHIIDISQQTSKTQC